MDGFANLKSKLLAEQIQDQLFRYILDTPVSGACSEWAEAQSGKR